jgi:adenine-specific DNA-methyltransferase
MQTLPLFDELVLDAPETEGIKYAGSKLKLLPHILQLAKRVNAHSVLDGFAGTTRVSQALAKSGYQVVCNDIAIWSKIFGTCYLLNDKYPEEYEALIAHLNGVKPVDGWFTQHYGGMPNGGLSVGSHGHKKPWQIHNTRKLDGIREEIERLRLSPIDKAVALTSLILALDQVDSSLGHFVSYLKEWSPRSYKELRLKVPNLFRSAQQHQVYQEDIFEIAQRTPVDLAYLDPPYGSNNEKMPPSRVRYASYYHIWTSICLFDKPELFGKANRRKDTSDKVAVSTFEEYRRSKSGRFIAVEAIEKLLQVTQARWIILSYSSGGRATADDLNDVIHTSGRLRDVMEIDYQRNVMAGMKWTNEWLRDVDRTNREFLFLIEKSA